MAERRFSQSSASPFAERKTGISIMTKAALLSSAALAVFLAVPAASAADLPFRKSPPASAPEPIFTWTGFYVGYNQGFGGGVLDANVNLAGPGVLNNTQTTNRANGFFVGGEAGYDYQFSNNRRFGRRDGHAMERDSSLASGDDLVFGRRSLWQCEYWQ